MASTLKFKNLQERKNEKNDISEFHDLQPKFSNSSFHEIHNQFLFHVLFPELTDFQNGGNPVLSVCDSWWALGIGHIHIWRQNDKLVTRNTQNTIYLDTSA